MSLPERPGASQSYEQRNAFRNSPSRRNRPADVEAGGYTPVASRTQHHQRAKSSISVLESVASNFSTDKMPLSPTARHATPDNAGEMVSRKRSLVRPERNRIGKDHPNYHYRKHAAKMNTIPSSTGNDPLAEDIEDSTDISGSRNDGLSDTSPSSKGRARSNTIELEKMSPPRRHKSHKHKKGEKTAKGGHGKSRHSSSRHSSSRGKEVPKEVIRPPSLWNFYCSFITFWCPDFMLSCGGKKTKAQRRAWREKVGLISLILSIMGIVGFLTFGFNQAVCGTPPTRMRTNEVTEGYMIFHGVAYDLVDSGHPVADGIPAKADGTAPNILFDIPDSSFGGPGRIVSLSKRQWSLQGLDHARRRLGRPHK